MITVNELVSALRGEVALVAGRGGGDRLVTWAHVCDLPDPWTWVRPGDLVLTTGDGLPREPEEQRDWLARLVDVGVSGLVLAPRPGAPTASTPMLAMAEERSVALLTADFSLEFVRLSRIVIESSVQSERDHISMARRLFDVYSEALRTRTGLSGRLDAVARSVGWSVMVVRSSDGSVLARSGGTDSDAAPITVPVNGRIRADVVVRPDQRRVLDGALVHYLGGLVGIELEHLAESTLERRRRGGAALAGALDGSVGLAQLRHELDARGMADARLVVAHLSTSPDRRPDPGDRTLVVLGDDFDVDPLVAEREEGTLVVMCPAEWPGFDEYRSRLAPDAYVGLSHPFALGADLVDAHLEARIAASRAAESGRQVVHYDDLDGPGTVGPQSATETRSLVARVLGPILEHDRTVGAELLETVETFLHHDRSWTRTAAALGVHRQTLVYRLQQVERLTGVRPTSTAGIAQLWVALRAGREASLLPPRQPRNKS